MSQLSSIASDAADVTSTEKLLSDPLGDLRDSLAQLPDGDPTAAQLRRDASDVQAEGQRLRDDATKLAAEAGKLAGDIKAGNVKAAKRDDAQVEDLTSASQRLLDQMGSTLAEMKTLAEQDAVANASRLGDLQRQLDAMKSALEQIEKAQESVSKFIQAQ